jgi:hypothetical protein
LESYCLSDQAKQIKLKPFQDRFLFSKARYPAMVSGWGTGKTMLGIFRAMIYSENIPNNLGVIFRKEYTDLRDSTLRDFEEYTGLKVSSQRNVDFKNGSRIMFRHIEELNNIQNMNLGWFFIEQAEELATDKEFFMLWGRLRRALNPDPSFLAFGLPIHTGFVIGNVKGSNWIKKLWKNNNQEDFELIEATTFDNADNLEPDYIASLERLKSIHPEIYARYVMNDWDAEVEGLAIPAELIEACTKGELSDPVQGEDYVLGSDFAKRQDWWVIAVLNKKTGQLVYFDRFQKESWGLMKGKTVATAKRYNNALVIPDSTGIGDPITEDLKAAGCRIWEDDKSDRPGYVFSSKTKEQLIENLIITMTSRKVSYPEIKVLIDELKEFERTISKAGSIKYSAPDGKNDDCVIGLALACWGLKSGESVMSMTNIMTGERL